MKIVLLKVVYVILEEVHSVWKWKSSTVQLQSSHSGTSERKHEEYKNGRSGEK